MNSKPDLISIANQDWSKFDFTRWNLEGLPLDPQAATLTSWVRDVTLTPSGPQRFAEGLVAIKSAVLKDFQGQVKVIQDRLTATDTELTSRIAAAQIQISTVEESIRVAGVPLVAAPDPESFQVVVKVLQQENRVGLPGLQVRLHDARAPQATLAGATTDLEGNALLKLNREQVDSLTKNNSEIALEVLTPANKSILSGVQVPAPKLNQTGTVLVPLPGSADVAGHLGVATAALVQRQALLTAVTARVADLQTNYQQIKDDLQLQLQQLQQTIADL
jgi:hypothetical protein